MSDYAKAGVLRGHSDAVLCCEYDSSGHIVASASEDGTAGVFDVRSRQRSHELALQPGGETGDPVTAVAFHPGGQDHVLYAAVGCQVHVLDLRQVGSGSSEGGRVHSYALNSEEINSIAVNKKGTHLAAADDSGEVKVIMVTGGMDSRIVKWDYASGRARHTWDLSSEAVRAEDGTGPMCNPPFVHALAVCPPDAPGTAGRLMAAARGDCTVAVAWAQCSPGVDLVISGGNDARIVVWNCAAPAVSLPGEGGGSSSSSRSNVVSWRHGKKVNWIGSSMVHGASLAVADTSRHVILYEVK
eukprot:jgi/Mesen1/6213/ME000320S05409